MPSRVCIVNTDNLLAPLCAVVCVCMCVSLCVCMYKCLCMHAIIIVFHHHHHHYRIFILRLGVVLELYIPYIAAECSGLFHFSFICFLMCSLLTNYAIYLLSFMNVTTRHMYDMFICNLY